MAKINDWMAVLLNNGDDITMSDIIANGITPDNTTMQSEDYYKNIDSVKEKFTKDGKFDENSYKNFYNSALSEYNKYANGEFEKQLLNQMEMDPYDWTDPLSDNRQDYTASLLIGYNPDRRQQGVVNPFEIGAPSFSIREVAQANNVRDEDGNKLDWTPNERGGLFESVTRPNVALASWDEDGYHIENGIEVPHRKGDYKYDENGDPYYEILGNRESYGKDVLRWTDTITVDGTKLNSLDFLDSDGLNKSAGKIIFKTAASIAPLLIPGVGKVYGFFKAFADLAKVFPTLGKEVNGFITNNNENKVGSAFTTMENYMQRFAPTTSDYSRQRQFSLENIGNIFSDSAGQLFSQRSLAKVAHELFSTGTDVLKSSKLAQNVALGYMALTSNADTYSMFKEAGASDRVAGVGALAMTGALYTLMNQDYFRDQLFQGTYMTQSDGQDALKMMAKDKKAQVIKRYTPNPAENKAVQESMKAAATSNGVKGFAKFFKTVETKGKDLWKKSFGKPETAHWIKNMWYGSINEATEETMEEVLQDSVKAAFYGLNALGIPMTTDKSKKLDFDFSIKDMAARYGSAFFGGFLGGATFEGFNLYENRNIPYRDWKHLPDGARKEVLFQMVTNPNFDPIKIIKAWNKKGNKVLGNKNLSASKYRTVTDVDGNIEYIWEAGSNTDNQNNFITNRLLDDLNVWDKVIKNEGILLDSNYAGEFLKNTLEFKNKAESLGISVEELEQRLGETPITKYIMESGLDVSTIYDDILENMDKIQEKRLELDALRENFGKESKELENKEGSSDTLESKMEIDQKNIERLESELSELIKERNAISNGDHNAKYVEQILFTSHPELQSILFSDSSKKETPFAGSNVQNYVKVRYGLNWNNLDQEKQEAYKREFNKLMDPNNSTFILKDSNGKEINFNNKIRKASKLFSEYNKRMAKPLKSFNEKYKDSSFDETIFYKNEEGNWKRKSKIQEFEEISKEKIELEKYKELLKEKINSENEKLKITEEQTKIEEIKTNIEEYKNELKTVQEDLDIKNTKLNALNSDLGNIMHSEYNLTEGKDFISKIISDINIFLSKYSYNQEAEALRNQEDSLKDKTYNSEKINISDQKITDEDILPVLKDLEDYYKILKENKKVSDSDTLLKCALENIAIVIPDFTIQPQNVLNQIIMNQTKGSDEVLQLENEILSNDLIDLKYFLEGEFRTLNTEFKDALKTNNINNAVSIYKNMQEKFNEKLNIFIETVNKDNTLNNLDKAGTFNKKELIEGIVNEIQKQFQGFSIIYGFNMDSIIEHIENIAENKKDTLKNPTLDLISELDINIDQQSINILELLKGEKNNLINTRSLKEYIIEDPFKVEAIKQLLDILNLLKSSVMVASDGYNKAVNEFKTSKEDKLAELDPQSALVLIEDIEYNQYVLKKLLELSNNNTISKAQVQEEIELNCHPKFIRKLLQGWDSEDLIKKDQLCYKISHELLDLDDNKSLKDIWDEAVVEADCAGFDLDNFEETEYDKFNNISRIFQNKLYDLNKNTDVELGKKLVNIFSKDLFKQIQTKLVNDKDLELTEWATFLFLFNVFSTKADNFYKPYLETIKNSALKPFYSQEFVIRTLFGFAHNEELVNSIIDRLNELTHESSEKSAYVKEMRKLQNTIFVSGGAGVGKSTVIIKTFLDMINSKNVAIAASSEKLFSKDKLGALISEKHPYKTFTNAKLLEESYEDFSKIKRIEEKNKEEGKEEENPFYNLFDDDELKNSFKGESILKTLYGKNYNEEDPKILIVDEATLLDEGYVQALNYMTKTLGIKLVFMGDPTQNASIINGASTGILDFTVFTASNLVESVRADNIAKTENNKSLYNPISNVNDKLKADLENNNIDTANKLMKEELLKQPNNSFTLKYFTDSDGIIGGEKLTDDRNYAISMINKIIEKNKTISNPEEKLSIAIITDDNTNPRWNNPDFRNENIDIINYEAVQGGEYDYVIIDKEFIDHVYLKLKDLYTLFNRSSKGSIIIDSNGAFNGIINNIKEQSSARKLDFSDIVRDKFIEWKTWTFNLFKFDGENGGNSKEETSGKNEEELKTKKEEEEQRKDFESFYSDDDDADEVGLQLEGGIKDFSSEKDKNQLRNNQEKEKRNQEELKFHTRINSEAAVSSTNNKESVNNYISYDEFSDLCHINQDGSYDLLNLFNKGTLNKFNLINAFREGIPDNTELIGIYKYLSSIIIDNINLDNWSSLPIKLKGREKFNKIYSQFRSLWQSKSPKIFYFKKIDKNKKLILYKTVIDSVEYLIPVSVLDVSKCTNDIKNADVLKKKVEYGETLFNLKQGVSFQSSEPGKQTSITNACKAGNIYIGETGGLLSIKPEDLEESGDFPVTNEDPKIQKLRRSFAKKTNGHTLATFTANYWFYLNHLADKNTSDHFLYKREGKRKVDFTNSFDLKNPEGEENNVFYNRCAHKHVVNITDLKTLVSLGEAMAFLLGRIQYENLSGVTKNILHSENDSINRRKRAKEWISQIVGDISDIKTIDNSDTKEYKKELGENFRLLSSKYNCLTLPTSRRLITILYGLLSESKDLGVSDLEINLLKNFHVLKGYNAKTGNSGKTGFRFYLRYQDDTGKFITDLYFIECTELKDGNAHFILKQKEWNSKSYEKIKDFDSGLTLKDFNDLKSSLFEFFDKKYKWNEKGIESFNDACLNEFEYTEDNTKKHTRLFEFIPVKKVFREVIDPETKVKRTIPKYYEYDGYDLMFKFLRLPNLNLDRLQERLLQTSAFKDGIYLREGSWDYFGGNGSTDSSFKVVKFSDKSNYRFEYQGVFAPVYNIINFGDFMKEDNIIKQLKGEKIDKEEQVSLSFTKDAMPPDYYYEDNEISFIPINYDNSSKTITFVSNTGENYSFNIDDLDFDKLNITKENLLKALNVNLPKTTDNEEFQSFKIGQEKHNIEDAAKEAASCGLQIKNISYDLIDRINNDKLIDSAKSISEIIDIINNDLKNNKINTEISYNEEDKLWTFSKVKQEQDSNLRELSENEIIVKNQILNINNNDFNKLSPLLINDLKEQVKNHNFVVPTIYNTTVKGHTFDGIFFVLKEGKIKEIVDKRDSFEELKNFDINTIENIDHEKFKDLNQNDNLNKLIRELFTKNLIDEFDINIFSFLSIDQNEELFPIIEEIMNINGLLSETNDSEC